MTITQLETLTRTAREVAPMGLPPVHLWNPPLLGDIDICIRANGSWWHEGRPMKRESLVRLFASILKKEEGEYYLVTPAEKWRLEVEDAPFLVVDCAKNGTAITLTTNLGDEVTLGADHTFWLKGGVLADPPRPYVHVRNGLEALVDRKSFYRLVEWAELYEENGQRSLALQSRGVVFSLGSPEDDI